MFTIDFPHKGSLYIAVSLKKMLNSGIGIDLSDYDARVSLKRNFQPYYWNIFMNNCALPTTRTSYAGGKAIHLFV